MRAHKGLHVFVSSSLIFTLRTCFHRTLRELAELYFKPFLPLLLREFHQRLLR